ncbi:site-2 protease family protein [Candidatus Woesearchaeota archaeon]|nr:site-2 protease family protein [Candidatus Woesearchaeota archaeon]
MKFSDIEKQHLLKSWVAVSLAFAILMGNILSSVFLVYFVIALITVGLGFLLHEIAHKYVAQKYGCWAEFRADDRMLIFAVFSAFLGFVFAAPGAVFIHGYVSKDKNGKISLAGPLMNIVLAVVFLGLQIGLQASGILFIVLNYGFRINSLIAVFNMIPFMNFDGAKIFRWNKLVYGITAAFAVLLVAVSNLPVF